MITPFDAMQSAVNIVNSSPHPENKVAACIFTEDTWLAATNLWPDQIEKNLGREARIGGSSGTVHAEVNVLLHFQKPCENAALCITDPCCPNCAKAISESGIKTVYIDHKGFAKDFASRRYAEFHDMSLAIMAHAGIAIYELNRKEQTLSVIHEQRHDYIPPEDNPIEVKQIPEKTTLEQVKNQVRVKHPSWGCALAKNADGVLFSLVASTHPALGYSEETLTTQTEETTKYSFYLTPLNRLLCGAARYGLKLVEDSVWTSIVPTPREMVNFIGAGYGHLRIGDIRSLAKPSSQDARKLLESNGVLTFSEI